MYVQVYVFAYVLQSVCLPAGDCWFIAAAAVLATKKELFAKVVPTDQGFEANYAGT